MTSPFSDANLVLLLPVIFVCPYSFSHFKIYTLQIFCKICPYLRSPFAYLAVYITHLLLSQSFGNSIPFATFDFTQLQWLFLSLTKATLREATCSKFYRTSYSCCQHCFTSAIGIQFAIKYEILPQPTGSLHHVNTSFTNAIFSQMGKLPFRSSFMHPFSTKDSGLERKC